MVQRLRCLVVVQEIGVRFPVESPNSGVSSNGKGHLVLNQTVGVRIPVRSPFDSPAGSLMAGQSNAMWSRGRTPASGAGVRRFESCRRDHPVRPMAGPFSYEEETSVRFTHRVPVSRRRCLTAGCALRNGAVRVRFPPTAPLLARNSMQSTRFLPGEMWVRIPLGDPTTAVSFGSTRVS